MTKEEQCTKVNSFCIMCENIKQRDTKSSQSLALPLTRLENKGEKYTQQDEKITWKSF